MDIKKLEERKQLEKFISNETLNFLVYDIVNSETPDFIAKISKKVISIEHSRLINPGLQEVEVYKDSIIKNAQRKFEDKYADKLYALITFNDIPLKAGKQEEQKYTSEVFNLIEKIYLNNKQFEFNIASKDSRGLVSPLIESFSVDNKHTFSHWQHFGAYIVEWIDMDWLQSRILKKEEKIKNYSTSFDENWLLLISDFGTRASASRTDFMDFSVIDSKFDRIYMYNYIPDEVTVIK